MTTILVPYKYYTYENAIKIEKIGFYEDELSNVYNVCTKCLSIHDRHSKYCLACSEEFKSGVANGFEERLKKNKEAIEKYTKEWTKKGKDIIPMQLNRFGTVVAILNSEEKKL